MVAGDSVAASDCTHNCYFSLNLFEYISACNALLVHMTASIL